MKKEETCPFQLDKRVDKLEIQREKLFHRMEYIEQYISVKKATNNLLERQKEKEDEFKLKLKYIIFGVLLTLIATLFEEFIFKIFY